MDNPIIQTMLKRRSVRKFSDRKPTDDELEAIVRAGMQAPFASQLYTIMMRRNKKAPFNAPLWFTICIDFHKLELFMKRRGWKRVSSDLSLFLFGIQDASYAAENMVIAAESLGMGSCFLGDTFNRAKRVQKQFNLPQGVFPFVELVIGFPAEEFPPRPRYPLEYTLFEDRYPEITDEMLTKAMAAMDDGYLAQGYYVKQKAKIPIEDKRKKDTFTYDDYSWTEHISRKWGQWDKDPDKVLEQFKACGFDFNKRYDKPE